MKTRLSPVLLLLSISSLAMSASLQLQSPERQIGLLELYTSEGCSSCPPAERWLSGLKDNARVWKEVIPIAFHVDYWDYIGWKDRFASPGYSKRQRNYAKESRQGTIYTPGFVYNGKEWRHWFTRKSLELPTAESAGVLAVNVHAQTAEVSFAPTAATHRDLNINFVLIGFDISTAVEAGENEGRKLTHDFVVLGMTQAPLQPADGSFVATLEIPRPKIQATRYGVVAWVSGNDSQRPLQTVGGMLPN